MHLRTSKMTQEKVLIAGAGGMLGRELMSSLAKTYAVVGLSRVSSGGILRGEGLAAQQIFPVDVLKPSAVREIVNRERPSVIINSVSNVFVNECERDPAAALELHVGVTETLTKAAIDLDAQLIQISTDSVFDGTKLGPYLESDLTNPLNIYARTKLQSEGTALSWERGLVLRTNIFGWRADGRLSFAEWVLDGLQKRMPLTMFTDVCYTPIATAGLAQLIGICIEKGVSGLFHAGGRDCLSKHEFALKLARAFNLSNEQIIPISVDQAPVGALRPKNMCLDSSALSRCLGVSLPTVDASIEMWMSSR